MQLYLKSSRPEDFVQSCVCLAMCIFCSHFIYIHESDRHAPVLSPLHPSLSLGRSTPCNASLPSVTAAALCCRASSWPSPRCYCHGDITVSIPWHCDKETAANATSLHPFNPCTLSFPLSLSILTQSILPSLTKYVCIDPVSGPLLSFSSSIRSFSLTSIRFHVPSFSFSSFVCHFISPFSFLHAISSPSPLHVFLSPSHSLSAY